MTAHTDAPVVPVGNRPGERVAAWDGLRGLAVLGVVAYHLRATWLPGGFLGVSLFFTLSGYLITGLLADELGRHGRVDLARFWMRRFKRLLPASLACIALVVGLARLYSDSQQARLRGDVLGVLAYVANWRFLASSVVYGGTDPNPSPLRHAWSLAIEEQFYLALPLVVMAGWWLLRGRGLPVVLGLGLVASLVAGFVVGRDPTVAYFRTDVRISEILIGALGALAVRSAAGPQLRRWCAPAAPLVLAGLVVSWTRAHETSGFLPRGGFALHAVGALIVVVGVAGRGPLPRVLRFAPLAGIGRISYGIYLYHWPLFLVLTPGRLGTSTALANALALAITLGVALISWFAIEQPIQRWTPRAPRRPLVFAPMASAAVLAVAALALPNVSLASTVQLPSVGDDEILIVGGDDDSESASTTARTTSSTGPPTTIRTSTTSPTGTSRAPTATSTAATSTAAASTAATSTTGPSTTVPAPGIFDPPLGRWDDLGRPVRILVTGDSVAWSIGSNAVPGSELYGLAGWAQDTGYATIWSVAAIGCGISTMAESRWLADEEFVPPERCDWRTRAPGHVAQVAPDVVMLLTGVWEVTDRKLPGDDEWRAVGDPIVDADLRASLREWITLHRSLGVDVVVILPPAFDLCSYFDKTGPCPYPEDDPARLEAWRDIEREIGAETGVTVMDFPLLLAEHGIADASARHDGLHWSPDEADRDALWLAPVLTDAAIRIVAARPT